MAKQCINCGKKINMGEKSFALANEGKIFCSECGSVAMPLLKSIKICSSPQKYVNIKQSFTEELKHVNLTDEAKKYIEYEFENLTDNISTLSGFSKKYNSRFFRKFKTGDFDTCFNDIIKAGIDISGAPPTTTPQLIHIDDAGKILMSVVFRCSNGSFSLTLFWTPVGSSNGTALLSTIPAFGRFSDNCPNWENDHTCSLYWKHLKEQKPSYVFDDLEKISPVICEKSYTDGISYEKKKCIGVLGGTFDPIHMGHVSLAYAALKEANLRKLIIMPAYVQPFKLGKRVTDDEFRMAMCKLAFYTNEHIEVSSMEVDRMMVSYTYDTLKSIKEEYPDDQIFFVTGTDSFLQIDTWYKGVQLLKNFSFIVSIRPGYREKELDEKIKYYKESYDTEIIKLTALMPNISATEIRKKIQAGDSVSGLIPESVERYIIKNGLYQGN